MSGEAIVPAARRQGAPGLAARAARAALACAGALALGAASLAAIVVAALWAAPESTPPGAAPPIVRSAAAFALGRAVFVQSLAPEIVGVSLLWLLVAARWPRLDARWWTLLLGCTAVGCALAPLVTHAFFSVWTPVRPLDSVRTWALLAASAAACLALVRCTIPGLGPGALGGRDDG